MFFFHLTGWWLRSSTNTRHRLEAFSNRRSGAVNKLLIVKWIQAKQIGVRQRKHSNQPQATEVVPEVCHSRRFSHLAAFESVKVCVCLSERKHSWTLYVWMTKWGHWWTYWRACQRPLWRSTCVHAWKSHIPFRLLRTSLSCPKLFSSGSCSSSCGDKDHWTTMYIFKVERAISYHWIGQLEALTQLKYAVHREKPSVPGLIWQSFKVTPGHSEQQAGNG